jgi:hypothetical protein
MFSVCVEAEARRACETEYEPWFSANSGAPAHCAQCKRAKGDLLASLGLEGDWKRSRQCKVFRTPSRTRETFLFVRLSTSVVRMVDAQMNAPWWKGPDHQFHLGIINLTRFFESFKAWLLYKKDKIKEKGVLTYTVKWMSKTNWLSALRPIP